MKLSGRYTMLRHTGDFQLRDRWWLPFGLSTQDRIPMMTFVNDIVDPLTFYDDNGCGWRPNRTFDHFDGASTPLLLQSVANPSNALDSSAGHDSGYEFGGSWRVMADGTEVFTVQTRAEVDQMWMHDAVLCESGSSYLAWKFYTGVRAGGGSIWDADRNGVNQRRALAMVASGKMPLSNL